ncbi:AAA family ATPase [Allosaccharopolyspora coralli]|uniref:DNA 3'-5' helicase n=1 Tax=Allosaccharopolyspora coralli TaxID=2665642 RepID=A0A5Q3QBD5_9PSEU|nr:UvrD-helicase domain-containing protein [Allosaccharopolyspora coralli]QGK68919.1 AAA family ATPase [Allosaccharopolyspora coralli]
MTALGVHRDFFPQYAKLEKPVRDRVDEVFDKFEHHTHAGLHLEKITGAHDPDIRTIRITKFWRGVVVRNDGDGGYLLLAVLPHDKAIEWARNRRVTRNKVSKGIEVRNDVALATATNSFRRLDSAPSAPTTKLFDDISDADLTRLGIDDEIRTLCRLLHDVDQLDALRALIPELQYDVLTGLAAGMTPEAVWQELAQNFPHATEDDDASFTDAMLRSQGHIVVVHDSDELAEVLERPFDLWRVFLHPTQRRIAAHAPYKGPARVTGGAGTGKTVVALHRAHHLARNPELPEKSILLTTFTKNLAKELARNLDMLVTDAVIRARIDVQHVDVIAHRYYRSVHGQPTIIDDSDRRAHWRNLAVEHGLDQPDTFLDQEWRQVVLAQRITTAEEYRAADRRGRGLAIRPAAKDQVWAVIESFQHVLQEEDRCTFDMIADGAADALRDGAESPYQHVIIDEAQDLHPSRWRLLRALVPPRPDDLFIAGDTHQRIYDSKVSLRQLGIHVTGRSSTLRINYRTSREILLWSTALLLGERVDDMDEGEAHLVGYRSSFRGDPPESQGFPDKQSEIAAVVAQVRNWLDQEFPADTIGVTARTVQFGKAVGAALTEAGIEHSPLDDSDGSGVRIGTMHKMKGLEFRCVAVADVSDGSVPQPNALTDAERDPQQHQQDLQSERNLLFVACTRAREHLWVSWHGEPSRFLSPVLNPA